MSPRYTYEKPPFDEAAYREEIRELFTGKEPLPPPPTFAKKISPWFCYTCIALVWAVASVPEFISSFNAMPGQYWIVGGCFFVATIMAIGVFVVLPNMDRAEIARRESKARLDAGGSIFPEFNVGVPMPKVVPPKDSK